MKMSAIKTAIVAGMLAISSAVAASPFDGDSIASMFQGRVLDPIEGVWQMYDDGAAIIITKIASTTYKIVLLDSPRLDIEPGTELGRAVATPVSGTYDATLKAYALGHKRVKGTSMVMKIVDGCNMQFKPYSEKWSISFNRWIYRMLRVTPVKGRAPEGLVGARRVYPLGPDNYKPIL